MEAVKKKAMWLYPKVVGLNPPERWGHSAVCSNGIVYVFGGCCGGLHFSDVLMLDLATMSWSSLATTGQQPGRRDSHSTALVGHKMIVFGGTNGSKKVNDLHILDLKTREWTKPTCTGSPPSPRESHTATVIGDDKLVIFGGSGEGEANYLNDVHALDLKSTTWTSPDAKGERPIPRDSHTAVAIGNKLLIYGGDCGDRYHGEVDVLDIDTMTWSKLAVHGSSPGVRAGHAAVSQGNKVYVIGGVGDKQYYGDVWVLDVEACLWSQLDIRGQQPQGRFSHTAVMTNSDIAIYGGCGEDERPLNEFVILQLGSEHPNGRYNISMCKIFGNHWIQEKRKFLRTENSKKCLPKNEEVVNISVEGDSVTGGNLLRESDYVQARKRKASDGGILEVDSEQEEHSLSLSQHSSPSRSDQEQIMAQKMPNHVIDHANLALKQFPPFKLQHQKELVPRTFQAKTSLGLESPRQPKTDQFLRTIPQPRQEMQFLAADQKLQIRPTYHSVIGAEVHGTVDGAFDSGYLMTANVNGQILRGVLFSPGPVAAALRPAISSNGLPSSAALSPRCIASPHPIPIHIKPPRQPTTAPMPECGHLVRQVHPVQVKSQQPKLKNDLQGLVLSLGGPRS